MKLHIAPILLFLSILFLPAEAQEDNLRLTDYRWTIIDAKGEITGRHEDSFVEYKGKFFLLGGRGVNAVNVFDPETNMWTAKGKSPMEIHHFQAVVYNDAIYMAGAMTGGYPSEPPLENIWIYYPEKDKWEKGPQIPEGRRRGGAGTVIYKDKIYMACGIELGHTSGTNNYFDSYDLKTGEWKVLTKAPHIRDHFPAIVVGDKMYCIGGRNSSVHYKDNFGAFFNATEPSVDYYDFTEEKWYTMKEPLPFPTAAGGIVNADGKLIYMGGEGSQSQAYNQTQCLDLKTGKWSQLAPLFTGRHGSGAIWFNKKIYIAAGSSVQGGGNMTTIEVFSADHEWKSLFNGINLDGWEIKSVGKDKEKVYWTFDNGTILCNSAGDNNHDHIWLQNINEYENFELRLKFQPSRENHGNAGVQVRSRYDDKAIMDNKSESPGWMDGPQVDIDPNNPWRIGLIYDETRGTLHWINPVLPDWKIEKEKYAPKKVIHYFDDQETGWNDLIIICNGLNIKTILNNILVSDYDGNGVLNDEKHKKYNVGVNGRIALQLHVNSDNYMRFKDIEIRELK